ncbi:MAG: CBS domain-containing protein [Cyanophyceae cyanobacterium]
MELILCHQTADFDSLGAAVGVSKLKQGKIVLTGGVHPSVKEFLALYRDEFPLIEARSVDTAAIRSISIVDTGQRDRLGSAAQWLDLPHLNSIEIYDHHLGHSDIAATRCTVAAVGSTSTLIAETLQQQNIDLNPFEATAMALGVHVDTGSLTFAHTTPRDARALAWLMEQGAAVKMIAEYVEPSLSPQKQQLLADALENLQTTTVQGQTIAWVLLETPEFVPGLSTLASQLVELTAADALLLAHQYRQQKLTVIGRSRIEHTDLNELLAPLGGGGHAQAASVTLENPNAAATLQQLVAQLQAQVPQPPTARELMSSPVRTIRPDTSIRQAHRILLRYGHSGLSVVDQSDHLVGMISRRDLDLALHHGFDHAPVKGYMSKNLKTIRPDTPLPEIESLMITYDIGRLPVLDSEQLVGIVTRTDVLRQLHQRWPSPSESASQVTHLLPVAELLTPAVRELLDGAARAAQQRGWHLYLVGGAVRDLLLAESEPLLLQDIDLVVDGPDAAEAGAGVELATALQSFYPNARLSIHGEFKTAALLWHDDPQLGSLWVDIATARTEFYPYPAANPEVEASSIRQDLYRRDFTINALALRLTPSQKLLDFFGGLIDLRARLIRVLYANSFIEDPTRIYRAVRFAVRLGFQIESQTEEYIRYAIDSGVFERIDNRPAPALTTRLKAELKYILQAPYWRAALQRLDSLGALRCLHPALQLKQSWWQIRYLSRWLRRLDPEQTLVHWQMRLETLLTCLPSAEREQVATRLQLPQESVQRLQQLEPVQEKLRQLPNCDCPSQVVMLLRRYRWPMLISVSAHSSPPIRRQIWQYLTTLAHIKAPLDGNDLKALGYRPGPQYKLMLDELLKATLDGEITNRSEAERFLETLNG